MHWNGGRISLHYRSEAGTRSESFEKDDFQITGSGTTRLHWYSPLRKSKQNETTIKGLSMFSASISDGQWWSSSENHLLFLQNNFPKFITYIEMPDSLKPHHQWILETFSTGFIPKLSIS